MKLKQILSSITGSAASKAQADYIQLQLEGLTIQLSRITDPAIPHEVTIVVPRAEIREKYDENNRLVEREVILNSITVVHSPRHPLAGSTEHSHEIAARFIPKET